MTDHYQDRPSPADADHDRGANSYVRSESEPLAELAQLIGQTDPFGTPAKSPLPLQSRANVRPEYALAEEEANPPAGLPSWRQEYEEPERAEPRASFAPLRGPASRSPRTGPSRATTRHGRAAG